MNVGVSLSSLASPSFFCEPCHFNLVVDFAVDFDSVIVSFVEVDGGSDTVDDLVAIEQLLA